MKRVLEDTNLNIIEGQSYNIEPMRMDLIESRFISSFNTRFFSFGSCFAIHISNALNRLGFNSFTDDRACFHYTTSTLLALLKRVESGQAYNESDLYYNPDNDAFLSPFHRMLIESGVGAQKRLLDLMNRLNLEIKQSLAQSNVVFLTLGTATYLQLKSNQKMICHGAGFRRADYEICRQSVDMIQNDLIELIRIIKSINPTDPHFVITVSPQRYNWDQFSGDSLEASNLDKSKLCVAVHQALEIVRNDQCEYFPSYDIVMDELRNYDTFHNQPKDHLHVSTPHTPNYVINRFLLTHCSEEVIETMAFYKNQVANLEIAVKFNHPSKGPKLIADALKFLENRRERLGCDHLLMLARSIANKIQTTQTISPAETILHIIKRLNFEVNQWVENDWRVVVYGAGFHTDYMMKYSNLSSCHLLGFMDRAIVGSEQFYGRPGIHPNQLSNVNPDVVFLSSASHLDEMRMQLMEFEGCVFDLYKDTSDAILINEELKRLYRG